MSTFRVELARMASATQRKTITVEAEQQPIRIERVSLHSYDQERDSAV